MQIDIVSDTVCPWCFIGKRKLDKALAERPDLQVTITWRPFQLNPDMPPEGRDRIGYLDAKFGGPEKAKKIYQRVADVGATVGIPFNFDGIRRTPSTLKSHALLRWAGTAGVQDKVAEILFERYFILGQDIGDDAVLVDAAKAAGMDVELVARLLAEGRDLDLVEGEDKVARDLGIQGVPCFIIDRKYAVSGAQDVAVFHQIFDTVARDAVAAG